MRDGSSQPHVRWYCKYHVVFVPKYRRKGAVWEPSPRDRQDTQGVMRAPWGGVGGGACDAGSHPPVFEHTAEIQRGEYGGVFEGQVGDPDSPRVSEPQEAVHGAAFLGARLLCEHGRTR